MAAAAPPEQDDAASAAAEEGELFDDILESYRFNFEPDMRFKIKKE